VNSTVHDLVGAWRLERWSLEYEDGRQSFIPKVIDHMMRVPDEAALAAKCVLLRRLGRRVGGSAGDKGSLVTLICDSGERYGHTYYSDEWITAQGFNLALHERRLEAFSEGGGSLDAS